MFSLGSKFLKAAATVRPPMPESKTPMGRTLLRAFKLAERRVAVSALKP